MVTALLLPCGAEMGTTERQTGKGHLGRVGRASLRRCLIFSYRQADDLLAVPTVPARRSQITPSQQTGDASRHKVMPLGQHVFFQRPIKSRAPTNPSFSCPVAAPRLVLPSAPWRSPAPTLQCLHPCPHRHSNQCLYRRRRLTLAKLAPPASAH